MRKLAALAYRERLSRAGAPMHLINSFGGAVRRRRSGREKAGIVAKAAAGREGPSA